MIDHYTPQNNGITSPTQSLPVEPPLLYHLLHACLFLVGCCVYPHQSVTLLGLGVIQFSIFFVIPIVDPNNGMTFLMCSTPCLPPLQCPHYHRFPLQVCCRVFLLSFGNLRPRHHFVSIFQRLLFRTPQTSQPTKAPPNQTMGA